MHCPRAGKRIVLGVHLYWAFVGTRLHGYMWGWEGSALCRLCFTQLLVLCVPYWPLCPCTDRDIITLNSYILSSYYHQLQTSFNELLMPYGMGQHGTGQRGSSFQKPVMAPKQGKKLTSSTVPWKWLGIWTIARMLGLMFLQSVKRQCLLRCLCPRIEGLEAGGTWSQVTDTVKDMRA